jgi:hypothetical protein
MKELEKSSPPPGPMADAGNQGLIAFTRELGQLLGTELYRQAMAPRCGNGQQSMRQRPIPLAPPDRPE